jgi:hypothetical protein
MPPLGSVDPDDLALLSITPELSIGDTETGGQLFEGRHGLICRNYPRPTVTGKDKNLH